MSKPDRTSSAACTCGKGDEAPAIVHADDCPCIDWVAGSLEGGDRSAAWLHEFVCQCREAAVEHQREARKLLELAARAENPPDGVTVEYGGRGVVRFVGPPVEVNHAA